MRLDKSLREGVPLGSPRSQKAASRVRLDTVLVPLSRSQQLAVANALRLLVRWAVRAARARVAASDSS